MRAAAARQKVQELQALHRQEPVDLVLCRTRLEELAALFDDQHADAPAWIADALTLLQGRPDPHLELAREALAKPTPDVQEALTWIDMSGDDSGEVDQAAQLLEAARDRLWHEPGPARPTRRRR